MFYDIIDTQIHVWAQTIYLFQTATKTFTLDICKHILFVIVVPGLVVVGDLKQFYTNLFDIPFLHSLFVHTVFLYLSTETKGKLVGYLHGALTQTYFTFTQ